MNNIYQIIHGIKDVIWKIMPTCHIVVRVTKVGNTVPTLGLEPTYLGQCAAITPCRLPDVTTVPMPTCLCSS